MAIDIKPSHKGLLHKKLGVPQGKKIPVAKLDAAKAKGGKLAKEANFAINAKSFNHDNRKGRLKDVKTDRGTFRLKANRKGEND